MNDRHNIFRTLAQTNSFAKGFQTKHAMGLAPIPLGCGNIVSNCLAARGIETWTSTGILSAFRLGLLLVTAFGERCSAKPVHLRQGQALHFALLSLVKIAKHT